MDRFNSSLHTPLIPRKICVSQSIRWRKESFDDVLHEVDLFLHLALSVPQLLCSRLGPLSSPQSSSTLFLGSGGPHSTSLPLWDVSSGVVLKFSLPSLESLWFLRSAGFVLRSRSGVPPPSLTPGSTRHRVPTCYKYPVFSHLHLKPTLPSATVHVPLFPCQYLRSFLPVWELWTRPSVWVFVRNPRLCALPPTSTVPVLLRTRILGCLRGSLPTGRRHPTRGERHRHGGNDTDT